MKILHLLLCLAVLVSAAFSQSFTAALRGTVTDASGSAIPGAKVTVTEADRNVPHATTTDPIGRYVVTALPPGAYDLTVEASGFQKYTQQKFQLEVQQQATIDVQMRVGDVSSAISVSAEATLLNTTIASLGQVIDNKTMLSMPNIGRDSLALAYAVPGVVGSAGLRRSRAQVERPRLFGVSIPS